MMRVEMDEPYDVIVASAGGFPLDIDLRQAHKGLENACQALTPGRLHFVLCRMPERRRYRRPSKSTSAVTATNSK